MRDQSACRTSLLGGHVEQCDACDYHRIVYSSCRNRRCCFFGGAAANIPLGPGIQSEAVASLLPSTSSGLIPVIPPGDFSISIQLPPTLALSYSEVFSQWILLDTTAPGFLGFSQAGKTVIYP